MSQSPRSKRPKGGSPTLISPDFLRRNPLPRPDGGGDKNVRGSVLIVGGAPTLPGAVILAATAALRAGAGDALARRHGPLGFLARELLSEIPALMASLSKPLK